MFAKYARSLAATNTAYRAARKKVIGDDVLPTSTLVIVEGLASPDMQIEVEAWAAKT